MTSLLDILQKEAALIKERELNFDQYVNLMHKVDDIEMYFNKKGERNEELAALKTEIANRKRRETDIDLEVAETRKAMRRYAARILEG